MAAPGCVGLLMASVGSVKMDEAGGRKGQNWPLPCLLALVSSVTGIVVPTSPWEDPVGLFNKESFFDIVSCSIPTDSATC